MTFGCELDSDINLETEKETEESTFALHDLCSREFVTLEELEDALANHPEALVTRDKDGRLPLHILGGNRAFILHPLGEMVATEFSKRLIELYPDGVITEDSDGRMPFTGLIKEWVESLYQDKASSVRGNNAGIFASYKASVKRAADSLGLTDSMVSTDRRSDADSSLLLSPRILPHASSLQRNWRTKQNGAFPCSQLL